MQVGGLDHFFVMLGLNIEVTNRGFFSPDYLHLMEGYIYSCRNAETPLKNSNIHPIATRKDKTIEPLG